MVSSASAQIEATGGRNFRTTVVKNGVVTDVPDYATVQGILIGVVAAFVVVITILGPEYVPLPHLCTLPSRSILFTCAMPDADTTRPCLQEPRLALREGQGGVRGGRRERRGARRFRECGGPEPWTRRGHRVHTVGRDR